MKILACVINWNSGELIKKALGSLSTQALDEIFVIDNSSRDFSPLIAQTLGFRVIKNSKNVGYAAAANQAMRYAESKDASLVLITNPDIMLTKNAVKFLAQALIEDSEAAAASPLVISEKTGLVEAAWYEFNFRHLIVMPHGEGKSPQSYASTLSVPAISGVSWMLKLSAFKKIGEFNEEFFLYHEDIEWCYRARMSGYRLILVPDAKVYHTGFCNDPKRRLLKAYFLGRNSVLFGKSWLTGLKQLKFFSFLIASVPLYLIKSIIDEETSYVIKGIQDGFKGLIDERIKEFLDI